MKPAVYADSSLIVSLVCNDSNSKEAARAISRLGEPLPFTPLHRIETRNAIRNAMARGMITAAEQRAAFHQIEADLQEGLLIHTPLLWTDIFRQADALSEKYSQTEGQRTLDLLHLATTLNLGAGIFLSFDQRQKRLAKAMGLLLK